MNIIKYKDYNKRILEKLENELSSLNEFEELTNDVVDKINDTIENSGGEFNTFVSSYNKSPEDFNILGLTNDSDIYDFYLKYRNDIDEILEMMGYFDEVPSENNVFGLYDIIIDGSKRVIDEIVSDL